MCDQAPADQPTEAPDAAGRITCADDLEGMLPDEIMAEIERLTASRNAFRYLSGRHLDRLRELEEVGKEHADCPTHLAVLTAALQAAERREVGIQKSIRRIVSFMEDAPELWGNPAADRVLGRLRGALAAPDRADQEGTK